MTIDGASVEVHGLVKRMIGLEYVARDEGQVMTWLAEATDYLHSYVQWSFREIALEGKYAEQVAEDRSFAVATVRLRFAEAVRSLGAIARSLEERKFRRLFMSIFEHEFGEVVPTSELTKTLYGYYERRSTQAIVVRWLPMAQSGKLNLPLPEKKGRSWIWTKEQAEEWRRWFASREESDD